jgi:hypothetical protein
MFRNGGSCGAAKCVAGGYGVTHNADSLRDRLALLIITILLLLTIAVLVDFRAVLLPLILARRALLLLSLVRILRTLLVLLALALLALLILLRPVLLLLLLLRLLILTIGHLQTSLTGLSRFWGYEGNAVTPPPVIFATQR